MKKKAKKRKVKEVSLSLLLRGLGLLIVMMTFEDFSAQFQKIDKITVDAVVAKKKSTIQKCHSIGK